MEFVVVLPIYFLLLGFAFVIGEIGLHAIRLTTSASRVYAMSPDHSDSFSVGLSREFLRDADDLFGEFVHAMTFDYDRERQAVEWSSGRVSDFDSGVKRRVDCVTDASFAGAWVKCVGAVVEDRFALTPITRGFVEFWYRWNGKQVQNLGGTVDSDASEIDKVLSKDDGRMSLSGKDMTGLYYGYFSLQRNEAGRWSQDLPDDVVPYRHWGDEALQLDDGGLPYWFRKVATEGFAPWGDSNVSFSRGIGPVSQQTGAISEFPLRNVSFHNWSGGAAD